MKLTVTTTATCRPEIFRRTLASFRAGLQGVDWKGSTIFINIDPIPAPASSSEILYHAGIAFGQVKANIPPRASFPAAVKWCWSKPEDEFFFHLEDDWVMKEVIYIDELVKILSVDPKLSCVNLRAYGFPPGDCRICLSPGLFRTTHAKVMAERMTTDANPEKQLRPTSPQNPHGDRHKGFSGVQFPNVPVISDIGRAWLSGSGYKKRVEGEGIFRSDIHFTTWEKAAL